MTRLVKWTVVRAASALGDVFESASDRTMQLFENATRRLGQKPCLGVARTSTAAKFHPKQCPACTVQIIDCTKRLFCLILQMTELLARQCIACVVRYVAHTMITGCNTVEVVHEFLDPFLIRHAQLCSERFHLLSCEDIGKVEPFGQRLLAGQGTLREALRMRDSDAAAGAVPAFGASP
jgi:hypothetical protein